MQEKRNDQPGNVVGLQYAQGDPEEENNSRPGSTLFDCESSQEVDESNAAVAEGHVGVQSQPGRHHPYISLSSQGSWNTHPD